MDPSETRDESDHDHEPDSFEDARDNSNTPAGHIRSRSRASIRSLTKRNSSSTPLDQAPTPTELYGATEPLAGSGSAESGNHNHTLKGTLNSQTVTAPVGMSQNSPRPTTSGNSAVFDDVQLHEEQGVGEMQEARGRSMTTGSQNPLQFQSSSTQPAPLPKRQSAQSPSAMPWGQPPPKPLPISRKLSSPFAWLSRMTSTPASGNSPPRQVPRRNTATSTGGFSMHHDLMLSRLDEDRAMEEIPAKETLKERFKLLRMKEEAGIDVDCMTIQSKRSLSEASAVGSSREGGLAINVLRANMDSDDGDVLQSPTPSIDRTWTNGDVKKRGGSFGDAKTRSSSVVSIFDPNLAPGTVSGLSTGPSAMQDPEAPVDWDLWQAVVYEGPAAVAKTSAAELNRAIASGIPSAIRGVVWQVLAHSKNEALEGVYRELVNRGTDKEIPPSPRISEEPLSASSLMSTATNKDSLPSSASSLHSNSSTPATTNGMTSPILTAPADPEAAAKMQAISGAERAKKTKEDLAALRKLEKTIRKDLGLRSNYSRYAAAAGLQDALFGVCKAYALYDEAVGYAQGMNFIVMPLLFNMPEEEAFCLLVRLMNHYNLREMFIQDMPGLHLHLYQFERLLQDVEPALCYHLHKRGIAPSLYATQWFLTLFAYRFPLQLVLRIYDLTLSEGLEGAILKFSIALMRKNAATLLSMHDMSALKTFLNERIFDVYIDAAPSANSILESGFFGFSSGIDKEVYRADLLVQDACDIDIPPAELRNWTTDYETRLRTERETVGELENLRSTNASLVQTVRSLEERAQRSDDDHVQMATEMIRTKMENEEIRSTNEDLMIENEELKKTIASLSEEAGDRLMGEMDRIMSRNIEVQNENRALEEQMGEMEQDLVQTKMRYAELYSDHEALKQKWTDLRRALE